MKQEERAPLISVICWTYNHEAYIKNALDSVLNQRIDFDIEIIVRDDASTDATMDIVEDYASKLPGTIRLFYSEKNLYQTDIDARAREDRRIICEEVRGKYIAFCEGDDFWIDNEKLQLQADYMESHPSCVMTCHNTLMFDMLGMTLKPMCDFESSTEISPGDVFCKDHGIIHLSSFFARAEHIKQIPAFSGESGIGDMPIQMLLLPKGPSWYINRVMSIYRRNHSESWSELSQNDSHYMVEHFLRMWRFCDEYNAYTDRRYAEYVDNIACGYIYRLSELTSRVGDLEPVLAKVDDKMGGTLSSYIAEFRRIQARSAGIKEKILGYARGREELYIYGAGVSGREIAGILIDAGVDFKAFVVTRMGSNDGFVLGKPVIGVSELAGERAERASVLVGIPPIAWLAVKSAMDKAGLSDRFCPYFPDMPTRGLPVDPARLR